MEQPTNDEKRAWFADALQRIIVIDLPIVSDDPQVIYLLFPNEDDLKVVVFFLQDYRGTGFSLILEKINSDTVNLKIYEPDTDDFHVTKDVVVRTDSVDNYRVSNRPDCVLSVGLLETVDSKIKIDRVTFLRIPIKSVTFK
jgi:hypothetical protein